MKSTSLSELVTQELERDPLLHEFIRLGLGNINAIAESYRPSLQAQLGRKLTSTSVAMAIRRHLERSSDSSVPRPKFPKHIDLSTRTGMYELAIKQSKANIRIAESIRRSIDSDGAGFLLIAQGSYEITFLTNASNKAKVLRLLGRTKRTVEIDDAAFVTVNWPSETKDIPGIYFWVTRALALRNISIQSFHTIGSEMVIVVKDSVLGEVHSALIELFSNASLF